MGQKGNQPHSLEAENSFNLQTWLICCGYVEQELENYQQGNAVSKVGVRSLQGKP